MSHQLRVRAQIQSDIASAGMGGDLQAAYIAGNTILATVAIGPVTIDTTEAVAPFTVQRDGADLVIVDAVGNIAFTTVAGRDITQTITAGIDAGGQRIGGDWTTNTGDAFAGTQVNIRGGDWVHTGGAGGSPTSNVQPGVGGIVSITTGVGGNRLTSGAGEDSGAMLLATGTGGTSIDSTGAPSGTITIRTGLPGSAGFPSPDGFSGTIQIETLAGGTNSARSGDILFDTRDGGSSIVASGGTSGDIIGTSGAGGDSSGLSGGPAGDVGWRAGAGGDTTAGIGAVGGLGGNADLLAGNGGDGSVGAGDVGGTGGAVVTGSGAGGNGNAASGFDGSGGDYTITVGVAGSGGDTPGTDGQFRLIQNGVTYVWPTDTPVVGDALRVATFAGNIATLEWAV